jgi:hypothetical protein
MTQSASKKVVCDVVVDPTASKWYGTLVTKNIRYEDDTPVTIQKFLGVKFESPTVKAAIIVNPQLHPYQPISLEITTEKIGQTLDVTAKIGVKESHKFQKDDTLTWQINGDLTV